MLTMRMAVAIVSGALVVVSLGATAANAQPQAGGSGSGPVLGKWQFTGKDDTGLVWKGTLTIEKLDPNRFDTKKYHSMCDLEVESTDKSKGTRGVEAPCEYHPGTRTVSFSTGATTVHSYTAVLASDGRSLAQGKWTESKSEGGRGSKAPAKVVRSGTWTATLNK